MESQKRLRIVFMGTPEFSVPSLDILLKEGYNVVTVITTPDKPAGRGQLLQSSAIKKYALEKNLPILEPEKLKDENFLKKLHSLRADLQVVVAFRMLPEVVWKMPPLGTINLHASLLPQYRGAAPINWAIINGEKETGLTTFFLQHEIDTGNIIFQEKVEIRDDETAGNLHDKLMTKGASLILKTVKAIEENKYSQLEQSTVTIDEKNLKKAPKIFKENCCINWNKNCNEVYNQIRGLSPYPAAYTTLQAPDDKEYLMKIFKAEKEQTALTEKSGTVVTNNKSFIKIATQDGYINLLEIQLAGKKRMTAEEFLRGFRIDNNWKVI